MSQEERYQKWEEKAKKFEIDNVRRATFILTVENALKLLKGEKEGIVLDVGCGFGDIDVLLAQKTGFKIVAVDISDTALEAARKTVQRENLEHRIKVEKGDIYNFDYPDDYFDIIFSFGYTSAASYSKVSQEVARVLKPGGILILDYINHHSLYKILSLPKRHRLYKKGELYSFNLSGIKKHFQEVGLSFTENIFFNTYPPILNKILTVGFYVLFEKTIGSLFKKILGRVILVCFKK
jgi:ubiquinone/menaquinone biosynthesis C-methylase UbiE